MDSSNLLTTILVVSISQLSYTCSQAAMTSASDREVQAIDNAIRGEYILPQIASRISDLYQAQKTKSSVCKRQVQTAVSDCKSCRKRCQIEAIKKQQEEQLIKGGLLLVYPGLILSCTATEFIVSTAPKALEKFGKESVAYVQKVGQMAEKLGKSILKEGDKLFQTTGKKFEEIGKKLEEGSKKLLSESTKALKHASDQVMNGVKDALDGLQDASKPLLQGTAKVLKDFGKATSDVVSDLGDGLSKAGSQLADAAGNALTGSAKAIESLGKQIFSPRISLPRVRLPRISLPRVRIGGWGKKRDSSCNCNQCIPFEYDMTEQDMVSMVCGSSYLQEQTETIKELNGLLKLHNFTLENQIITKIRMDLKSLAVTENGYYLTNAFMTIYDTDEQKTEVKMKEGMPFGQAQNSTHVAQVEGPVVYKLLV